MRVKPAIPLSYHRLRNKKVVPAITILNFAFIIIANFANSKYYNKKRRIRIVTGRFYPCLSTTNAILTTVRYSTILLFSTFALQRFT